MTELRSKIASREELSRWVRAARERTLSLMEGLSEAQLIGRRALTVNPMIWHFGHISWFQEKWVLRHLLGRDSVRGDADLLYDSFEVPHETRWGLKMPDLEETTRYSSTVLEQCLEQIATTEPTESSTYFNRLSVYHEDMHDEAMTYDRQTLRYPPPAGAGRQEHARTATATGGAGPLPGDVEVPGVRGFMLGGSEEMPFVFDNEKWAHPVDVAPFRIARAPVTNAEFAGFVEAGGYGNPAYWSQWGRLWLQSSKARHPAYWRRARGGGWQQRVFNRWVTLAEHQPAIHVNWHEAKAYCAWAGRRLPSEAEWEVAASTIPQPAGRPEKRRYPWGEELPRPEWANMDARLGGPLDVAALPEGDSAHGCRQMLGNVWEWTDDPFYPFPGFVVDPYKEYSAPWFGYQKVMRGGSWATSSRMIRNTWRNFFMPDRSDIYAGFRTCPL
jgi:iron(II)-dependent oxidoreductase